MSSNSVCNHTCDKQIGLPLSGRPILFITRMITDIIELHSVLLVVFSVTPYKIDQNKNQNRSIYEVQILRKERR